ncbi:MAG: hypothetical protein E7263_08260 [Lachnospiraceae bacterium]|nr:hypothetical protein [Lachnospiraceae bacterium]
MEIEELRKQKLFPPFEESINMLMDVLNNNLTHRESAVTINEDGPGKGNWGHSGRKGKKGGSVARFSASDYDTAIIGKTTSDGKTVKGVDPHLYKRANERKVYPKSIADALTKGKTSKGNTGNRTIYTHKGTNVIFDNDTSTVKTVIYKGKGR